MKKIIRKIVPTFLWQELKKRHQNYLLDKIYNSDKKRYRKYAYNLNNEYTEINLRSKITFHYHAIEKGLSNADLRLGFGKVAFEQLFFAMDKYLELGFPTQNDRFQSAISVIQAYVKLHSENDFAVEEIRTKLQEYLPYLIEEKVELGGYTTLIKEQMPNFNSLPFKELAMNRYSVRNFGEERISDEDILNAVQIASKSPSVCNRQAWKVYYIKDHEKIKSALELQGGFKGNGKNLKSLLLVTCDNQYMQGRFERNQTYIDGGLFTMSLLYALESKSIATCTLNTNFSLSKANEVRNLLNVGESENFIAFIAAGSYPETVKVAKSPRDTANTITKII